MSQSIFVIEQGEYSDYRVVGVFSSKKGAELVCRAINAGQNYREATVAEWPLDPGVADLSAGRVPFKVWMLRDGTTERVEQSGVSSHDLAGSVELWRRSSAPAYRRKGVQDCLNCTVWATDEQHAVKIVNEKRVQMIANGEWR